MIGLYLHVPFCGSICHYCNFNRGLFDAPLKARYVAALEREIRTAGDGQPADTIYFGGGTPSLLEPAEIGRLVAACRAAFAVAADAEVTLEANPETVTAARLAAYREAGVTRLSFGVQSFDDAELRALGRAHDAARARAAVAEARAAGFDNVSLDLMMWLPGQRLADWQASVEALVALGPEHASLYLLELYPNAPLREEMARAGTSQAPDEDAADMYLWALDRLDAAGYQQYRDLQRRPAGAPVAPQPEVLDRRRLARLRLRRALDRRRRAVAQPSRRPPTTSPWWRRAGRRPSTGAPWAGPSGSRSGCSPGSAWPTAWTWRRWAASSAPTSGPPTGTPSPPTSRPGPSCGTLSGWRSPDLVCSSPTKS